MHQSLPLAFDMFCQFHQLRLALHDDLKQFNDVAKNEGWHAGINLRDVLFNKRQAIVVRDANGSILFSSSNFDSLFMQLLSNQQLKTREGNARVIEVYGM